VFKVSLLLTFGLLKERLLFFVVLKEATFLSLTKNKNAGRKVNTLVTGGVKKAVHVVRKHTRDLLPV
jgi:hypothetical protein